MAKALSPVKELSKLGEIKALLSKEQLIEEKDDSLVVEVKNKRYIITYSTKLKTYLLEMKARSLEFESEEASDVIDFMMI